MIYLSILLLTWLLTGFLIGLKWVIIDKQHLKIAKTSQLEKDELIKKGRSEKNLELAMKLLSNKKTLLACCTLLGFVTLWSDLKDFAKKG
jgi:hypothetical protein